MAALVVLIAAADAANLAAWARKNKRKSENCGFEKTQLAYKLFNVKSKKHLIIILKNLNN